MNNRKVLIIDDDPVVLRLLEKKLSQVQGYEVMTARDGDSGIALGVQHRPDIVLLDIMMPNKTGSEVAEAFAQMDQTKDIPIIFISVFLDSAGKKRIEVNDREYRAISKPVHLPELLAQIRKAINEANN